MNKARHVVGLVALFCLIIGIVGIGVGFFMGSSPVVLKNHGSLEEYIQRLQTNWDVVLGFFRDLADKLGIAI